MIHQEIVAPQVNVNDTNVILLSWLVDDGSKVKKNDIILEIETSKAVVEVNAGNDGYLRIGIQAGQQVQVGTPLGWIISSIDENVPDIASFDVKKMMENASTAKATDKARLLAEQEGIDLDKLVVKGIITESHVKAALEEKKETVDEKPSSLPEKPIQPTTQEDKHTSLDSIQQTVMKTVLRSKVEQAPAYIISEARVDQSVAFLEKTSDKKGSISTLTLNDLAIHLVAQTMKDFPRLNATLVDNTTIVEHSDCNISTTVEVEDNLYMVVIRNANEQTLLQIYQNRLNAIMQLMRGEFNPELFSDSTFAVTVLKEPSTLFQIPIIYPGHAAILGLGGARQEIRPDADGKPQLVQIIGLCLTYDHRFINGATASNFLQNIVSKLENVQ